MRTSPCALALVALTATAHAGGIAGTLVDADSRQPVIGATVVATLEDAAATELATDLTDELGRFELDLEPGMYVVTFFFGETTIERRNVFVRDQLAPTPVYQKIRQSSEPTAWLDESVPLAYTGRPSTGTAITPVDTPLVRGRDHRGLAALDARARPAAAVTTVHGALRLPGAPAIAAEFIDEVEVVTTTPGPDRAGAGGGHLEVALTTGTNRHHGQVALELGPDPRFVAVDGLALDRDHVWWSSGVVLERTGASTDRAGAHRTQMMHALTIMDGPERLGQVSVLGTWLGDGGRDLWGDARVVLTTDDARRELAIGLTAEALDQASAPTQRLAGTGARAGAVHRVAGRLGLTERWRGRGPHVTRVGGEVGLGRADEVEHGDTRAFLGDEWTPRPSWNVDASVRWDRREVGTARVDAVLPRLAVAWDPTDAGRGSVFATAERVARLDEVALGAWRGAGAVAFDQATLGATRDVRGDVRVTIAVRGRRAAMAGAELERGVEGTVAWLPRRRFAGALTASTLEGAVTARASYAFDCERNTYTAAAIGRAERDVHGWGASAQWARRSQVSADLRLGLELFDLDDAAARTGRVVLAASW